MTPNLSQVNSKLKTERRAKQAVTRGQVESAKLCKKVAALTAQVDKLASGLKEAKAKLAKSKPSTPKPEFRKLSAAPEVVVTSLRVPKQPAKKEFGK